MTDESQIQQPDDPFGFIKVLNQHGYSYVNRVIKEAETVFQDQSSDWALATVEFPVHVRGKETRIDFILRSTKRSDYLVIECKRANPALKRWCFAKSRYRRFGQTLNLDQIFIETLMHQSIQPIRVAASAIVYSPLSQNVYHIALELRDRDAKGDCGGKTSTDQIEKHSGQVCLGLSGLLEYLKTVPPNSGSSPGEAQHFSRFMPVVVTTAELYTTEIDLSSADLATGDLNIKSADLVAQEWLFYQYAISPSIRHSIPPIRSVPEVTDIEHLAELQERDYIRTIAFVRGTSFGKFLKWCPSLFPS